MKKKYYLYTGVVVAVSIMLLSCLRDTNSRSDDTNITDNFTIAQAQEFFENLASEITIAGLDPDDDVPLLPIWNHGKSFTIDDVQMVQTPLNIVPSYSYEQGSPDSVYHRIIANTVTFLVMQREKGRKDVTMRVVRFIAEDDYLMDNPSKIFRFSLSSLSDYCGKIFNYDIRGNLLDGSVYRNGERTGIISPLSGNDAATRSYFSGGRYYERFVVSSIIGSRSSCTVCREDYLCQAHRLNQIGEVVVIGGQNRFLCGYISPSYSGGGSSGGGGGGGGGSSGGGSGSSGNSTKANKSLKKTANFAGYNKDGETNCLKNSQKILENHGQTNSGSSNNVFQLMQEQDNSNGSRDLVKYGANPTKNYKNAIDCIDRHLDNDKCIIVGVNHSPLRGINEGTTDHFFVIHSREYNSSTGNYEYLYYETATGNTNKGCSSDNRLIYDSSNSEFYNSNSSHYGKRLDVTQVRPNDGITTGTIVQPPKQ